MCAFQQKKYELLDWIPEYKLNWHNLHKNPSASYLLEANPDKINWEQLSYNSSMVRLLKANPDKIVWWNLSGNPNAVELLETNQDKIDWDKLSTNPNAIHLLEANQDKIHWSLLSSNPNAIHLLEANQDKIDWKRLSKNPNAIHLLETNPHRIDWWELSENPNATKLIEAYPDRARYNGALSENKYVIELLESLAKKQCSREYISEAFESGYYQPLIHPRTIFCNPFIFTINYLAMKEYRAQLHEELIAYVHHPSRVAKWMHKYGTDSEYLG